jgi:hypothetical protein
MKKQISRLMLVSLLLAAAWIFLSPATTNAQEGEEGAAETTATTAEATATTESYEYKVQPGDSVTVIVRRSLQLEAADKQIELSPAALLYCETTITNRVGARLLEIGETITVPTNLLNECLESSKSLSEAQKSAWQVYANQANLNQESVVPTSTPKAVREAAAKAAAEAEALKQATAETASDNNSASGSADWYWWILGGAAILALYFVLGGTLPGAKKTK